MIADPCTCMQYHPFELLLIWRRRSDRILKRMLLHGHGIDMQNTAETVRLVMMIERGTEETTSPKNAHRSHHMPGCPQSIRQTSNYTTSCPAQP